MNATPPILRTNCNICAHTPGMNRSKHRNFWRHIREVHNLSPEEFRAKYPAVKVHEHEESSDPGRISAPRTRKNPETQNMTLTIEAPSEPPIPTPRKPERKVSRPDSTSPERQKRTIKSIITHMERERPRLQRATKRFTRIYERALKSMQEEMLKSQ